MITYPTPSTATTTQTWLGMATARRRRKTPLILLVEDDRMIAEMYRFQLVREGYDVQVAGDGKQGLEAIRARKPDLVLLDLRLPVLEGFEVLQQLQTAEKDVKNIPVVILSNYGEPRIIRQGLELGARDYLIKSATTPITLAAKVKALLANPPARPPPTHL
jgi:two-component system alkaline phosphatase synthesis response regulator PhoP